MTGVPSRRVPIAYGIVVYALVSLTACSGGLRSSEPTIVSYVLRAPVIEASASTPSHIGATASPTQRAPSVRVLEPAAEPGLASDGIALITADSRLDRYAGSRWADELPRVVSALAVRTLRGSSLLGTISDDSAPFGADYLLRIDIEDFEARYSGAKANGTDAPTIQVRLQCTLARHDDHAVIASFTAQASEPANANRMTSIITAFDAAERAALTQLRQKTEAAIAAQAIAAKATLQVTPDQKADIPVASMKR